MYKVITANSIDTLNKRVSQELELGWLTTGGVTTQGYSSYYDISSREVHSPSNSIIHYLQAIYKPQKEEML